MKTKKLLFYSCVILFICLNAISCQKGPNKIDRRSLVSRHNPSLTKVDTLSSFTVGNGEFAFTADVTGLQTFFNEYENGIPLGTQSHWGWHSYPNPNNYKLEESFQEYDTYGRPVNYASNQRNPAAQWLRANPQS